VTLLEIFKPGRHTAMSGAEISFSESDLKATAEAYDPKLHEAPLVVGHPKIDAPAYGWVKALAYSDTLQAEPDQVDPAFAELVNQGRFKKISASFFAPDSPHNPKPGVYYLRHVGFLGAQPPAVKGLKSASFAGGGEGVIEFGDFGDVQIASMWRRLRDWIIGKFGLDEADKVIPDYVVASLEDMARSDDNDTDTAVPTPTAFSQSTQQETEMDKAKAEELAAREAAIKRQAEENAAKDAQFAEREKAIADKEKAAHRKELAEFVEKLVAAGKVLPRDRDGLVAFMANLNADDVIEFGEGDAKQTPAVMAWLGKFLENLPKAVEYGERAAAEDADTAGAVKSVKVPEGYTVAPERAQTHTRALQYAEANKVDYITAVRAVEHS